MYCFLDLHLSIIIQSSKKTIFPSDSGKVLDKVITDSLMRYVDSLGLKSVKQQMSSIRPSLKFAYDVLTNIGSNSMPENFDQLKIQSQKRAQWTTQIHDLTMNF